MEPLNVEPVTYRSLVIIVVVSIDSAISGGIGRCFGVFINKMKNEFNHQAGLAAVESVWTISYFMQLVLIPILTFAICRKCKKSSQIYRCLLFIAAILIASSWISSAFVTNIVHLYVTLTIPTAFAYGLSQCVCMLGIREHFPPSNKYYVLASNLYLSGAIGAVVMSVVIVKTVNRFGWRRGLAALGVLLFITKCCCAIVFSRAKVTHGEEHTDDNVPHLAEHDSVKKMSTTDVPWRTRARLNRYLRTLLWSMRCCLNAIILASVRLTVVCHATYLFPNVAEINIIVLLLVLGEALGFITACLFGEQLRGHFDLWYISASVLGCIDLIVWGLIDINSLSVEFVMTFLFGCTIGAGGLLLYAGGAELCGIPGHIAFSISATSIAFGLLAAPAASGLIIQTLGFRSMFQFLAFLATLNSLVVVTLSVAKRYDCKK